MAPSEPRSKTGIYVAAALVVLGAGVWGYMRYIDSRTSAGPDALTPEAKAYVQHLNLGEVTMKANKSFLTNPIIEIEGRIANSGDRSLAQVEIFCVFYDAYGQVVLRQRMPIVSARTGGLKPGEAKPFRLPFDDLPQSWNQQMPQLVIAAIRFQ